MLVTAICFSVILIFVMFKVIGMVIIARKIGSQSAFHVLPGAFNEIVKKELGTPEELLATLDRFNGIDAEAKAMLKFGTQKTESIQNNKIDWAAAAMDGGVIPAIDLWARWSSVDAHVFNAFEHLTHEQINGVSDMLKTIDTHDYSIHSGKFFDMLKGHVGEYHALEHFQDAGASVAMPLNANEPGFDLLVNGHELNVKTVADAGNALSSHLAHYESSIVVPFDSGNIPADALHFDPSHGLDGLETLADHKGVIIDHALSLHEVSSETANALDVASDPGAHIHFPWVTAAVSIFRETKLLLNGHTDFSRMSKNVAIDTVSVGGSALVGLKAGALAGSFFGPVGAAIGGVVGGAMAAFGGRQISKTIKEIPLKEAEEKYQVAHEDLTRETTRLNLWAGETWISAQAKEQADLNQLTEKLQSEMNLSVRKIQSAMKSAAELSPEDVLSLLTIAEKKIIESASDEEKNLNQKLTFWQKIMPEWLAAETAVRLKSLKIGTRSWVESKNSLLGKLNAQKSFVPETFDLLLAAPIGEELTKKYIVSIKTLRQRSIDYLEKLRINLNSKALAERMKSINQLRHLWTEVIEQVELELQPKIVNVKISKDELFSELAKAGLIK